MKKAHLIASADDRQCPVKSPLATKNSPRRIFKTYVDARTHPQYSHAVVEVAQRLKPSCGALDNNGCENAEATIAFAWAVAFGVGSDPGGVFSRKLDTLGHAMSARSVNVLFIMYRGTKHGSDLDLRYQDKQPLAEQNAWRTRCLNGRRRRINRH